MSVSTHNNEQFFCENSLRKFIINKTSNNKYQRGCKEKGTLIHCWWECKLVQRLWKTVWSFPKNLIIKLPYDSATPFLGIYLKNLKTYSQRYMHTYVHCNVIQGGQDMKKTIVSFDRGLAKVDVVHIYSMILFSYKKR